MKYIISFVGTYSSMNILNVTPLVICMFLMLMKHLLFVSKLPPVIPDSCQKVVV